MYIESRLTDSSNSRTRTLFFCHSFIHSFIHACHRHLAGIPIDKEIFLPNGELGLKWWNEWLNCRELEESRLVGSSMSTNTNSNNNTSDAITTNDNTDSGGEVVNAVDNNNTNTTAQINTNTADTVPVPVITIVRKFDVLFGKGKTRKHVGNLRCAYLVEQHEIEYENANKIDKTLIANKIVNIVKENNGRFLKNDKQVRTTYSVMVDEVVI
jgi:hypothetical protein